MAYDALKAAWLVKINAQYALDADLVTYETAKIDLDQMIAALSAAASATSTDVQSYSIAGRSVTRRTGAESTQAVNRLRLRLQRYCGSGVAFVDDFQSSETIRQS